MCKRLGLSTFSKNKTLIKSEWISAISCKGFTDKILFTFSVFEEIKEDYFISREIPDRLFTRLGLEEIIP
jgi:hypothetical protein